MEALRAMSPEPESSLWVLNGPTTSDSASINKSGPSALVFASFEDIMGTIDRQAVANAMYTAVTALRQKDTHLMNNNEIIIDLTGSPCHDDVDEDEDLRKAICLSLLPPGSAPVTVTSSSSNPSDIGGWKQQYLPGHFLNNGELKVIQSRYDADDFDKIGFDDLLQADAGLLECVLSSYVIDEEWLMSKILHVPSVTIALHSGDRNQQTIRSKLGRINIVYCKFPSFPSYGVMHCKLMILRYRSNILRIVVSTGNLVPYDYGHVQNMVFIEDLQLLDGVNAVDGGSSLSISSQHQQSSIDGLTSQSSRKRPLDATTAVSEGGSSFHRPSKQAVTGSFKGDLMRLLEEMGLMSSRDSNDRLTAMLNRYDWTRIKAKLVYSIPGTSYDRSKGSGLMMLSRKVMELRKDWPEEAAYQVDRIECQGSSLGNMDRAWLSDVLQSCSADGRREHCDTVDSVMRIVFPTMTHALEGGAGNFGTIFCKKSHWDGPKFPRTLFYRCESLYGSHQPLHSKTILCQYKHKTDPQQGMGWLYVGSHNFTASAWGKFIKDKQGIMVSNYEVGVLLPVEATADLKLPYKRSPLSKYAPTEVPWMQEEQLKMNQP